MPSSKRRSTYVTMPCGHRLRSRIEVIAWDHILAPTMIPWVSDLEVPVKPGMSRRRPDFFAAVPGLLNRGLAVEIVGLVDDPGYQRRWQTEKIPSYAGMIDWYCLVLITPAHCDDLRKGQLVGDHLRRLWDDGQRELRRVLADEDAGQAYIAMARDLISGYGLPGAA